MWNICDCLVLWWCDCRALFSSVEEMKGWAHCEQLLRKQASKQAYFKLFHRSTDCLDWLLIPVSFWRKHIFSRKHVQPHVELQVWKLQGSAVGCTEPKHPKSRGPTFPILANGTSLLRKVFLAPSAILSFGFNSVRSRLWLGSCRLSLDWQMKQSLGLFWTLERDCLFCKTLGLVQGVVESAWITALPNSAKTWECKPLRRCYRRPFCAGWLWCQTTCTGMFSVLGSGGYT